MEEEKIIIDKWFDKKLTISVGKLLIIATLLLLILFFTKLRTVRNISARDKENGLEIRDLVRQVKLELMQADTDRIENNEHALFKLKDFSMEISFTVRSTNKMGTDMDYKFVTIANNDETANEKVQKLMLHWDVIPPKADTLHVDDTSEDMKITPDSSMKIKSIK